MSSSACCDVDVNGFSTNTCLPFSSAAFASSKCVQTGVTMATASISGDVQDLREVRRQVHARIRLAARASARRGSCRRPRRARSCRAPLKFLTMFGPPVAVADDADPDHVRTASGRTELEAGVAG